ncbi:MAG: adenylyltransferase/cytidyltransferase family protein [Patescibacteria group bacterium]
MLHNSKTRVMVFGTFDVLHKGHWNFFKQARKLSKKAFLIVSVARDVNVKKIKSRKPINSEKIRLKNVFSSKLVNKALLGGLKNHITHITQQKPDIIALGYDQKAYTKNLKRDLTKKGLNVKIKRLKAFKPNIYKSSKII